jgi:flagellar assembly protein FliH
MLLKPSEVEYVLLQDEEDEYLLDSETESEQEEEIPGSGPIVGKTILIGGTDEPIYLDEDISFQMETDEDEEEFIFGNTITIGSMPEEEYQADDYGTEEFGTEEYSSDFNEVMDEDLNESLYDLDTEFDLGSSDDLYSDSMFSNDDEEALKRSLNLSSDSSWESSKHTTLRGKVDHQLLSKIKEYRENIHEMSEEKLSALSSEESRDKLLLEAAQLTEEVETGRDINQVISEIDKKLTNMIKKHTDSQLKSLNFEREAMLQQVEREIGDVITQQIETIKSEAEEHIDETVQYYKKKLESDNQVLSTANNIISRREQILDEAYAKSLSLVEEAEEQARAIIERSANAQEEAEQIIAEFEAKGEEIRQEAEIEAERIISDANVESARIIQAAEDQHQDIVEAATQDGFSVGYQEGKEEAIKENSELLREATNALNKLHAAFPVAVKQNEEKLIKIAYQIAYSVLGNEHPTERPELCEKVLNQSIKYVSDLDVVKIKVNPSDLDLILPKQEYFKAVIPDVQEFIITGSADVAKGGCVINTTSDVLNISINSQLSVLEAVFNEALAEFESEEAYQEQY